MAYAMFVNLFPHVRELQGLLLRDGALASAQYVWGVLGHHDTLPLRPDLAGREWPRSSSCSCRRRGSAPVTLNVGCLLAWGGVYLETGRSSSSRG